MMQKIFGGSGKKEKEQPASAPVITRRAEVDNRTPAEKFAMQFDKVYRVFPADAPESAVQAPCDKCGSGYDGPTQTHCPHCSADRPAYMLDVTDKPFHALPAEDGKPIEIPAEEMIPTFGGKEVFLGQECSAVMVQGSKVTIGANSDVDYIAGNAVEVGQNSTTKSVVGKDNVILYLGVECEYGVTGKLVSIGQNCTVGRVVIPEGGTLRLNDNVTINTIYMGRGSKIEGNPHNLTLDFLVVLDSDCSIHLGSGCTVETIEAEVPFQISAGSKYENNEHIELEQDYNLAVLIDNIVQDSLGKGEN